jgi:shikimate 5-dehydrogenase
MRDISGTTRIFPVIGWPVEQVKAPALFNAYFQRHDIDARVVPFKVPPRDYIRAVHTLMAMENVGGIFVSIPHKPMSVEAVDQPTARALLAGSCNAIYKDADGSLIGDLIDGEGFVRAFDRTLAGAPFGWATAKALVVGSGGVGCAAWAKWRSATPARNRRRRCVPACSRHSPRAAWCSAGRWRKAVNWWSIARRWACMRTIRCRSTCAGYRKTASLPTAA